MNRILDFRFRPAELSAALDQELNAHVPPPDAAVAFRDLSDLSDHASTRPEMMDWMATLAAQPTRKALDAPGSKDIEQVFDQTRRDAKTHAEARWQATHDPAWLIAAMSLTSHDEPSAKPLLKDASKIGPSHPAWVSLEYQSLRLRRTAMPRGFERARMGYSSVTFRSATAMSCGQSGSSSRITSQTSTGSRFAGAFTATFIPPRDASATTGTATISSLAGCSTALARQARWSWAKTLGP
jgi:hypothetical protein